MKAYKQNWKDFTVIPNEIFRHGLSLKAIGLFGYIVNKPDGWDFSIDGIKSQTRDGRDSVRAATRELEEVGFLKRSQERKPDGQMGGGIWLVFDKPSEKPTSGEATSGVSRLSNTQISNTRERGENTPTPSFDKQKQAEECFAALTPEFVAQFRNPHANDSDIKASAKKCFAWHLKKGIVPNDWEGALYYWLVNEDWSRNE